MKIKNKTFRFVRTLTPTWVCFECGNKYGNHNPNQLSTVHTNTCDICKQENVSVTEGRDFKIYELEEYEEVKNAAK